MMESCSSEEEEEELDRFFDTQEDFTSISDSGPDCSINFNFGSTPWFVDPASDVWIKNPDSVHKRRHQFFKWMGIDLDRTNRENSDDLLSVAEFLVDTDRITEESGAVLGNSDSEDGFSSGDTCDSSTGGVSEENCICRIKNLDNGTEFIVDELGQDGMLSRLREVGSDRLVTIEEMQRTLGFSPLVQQFMRESDGEANNSVETTKRVKIGWLRRLGAMAGFVDRQGGVGNLKHNDFGLIAGSRVQRVRVRPIKKRSKEFSALYTGQEIMAHKGSILTMKFSPDGQYLASAGEDGIVRVWQIMESERSNEVDILNRDSSSAYFMVNHLSELVPLFLDKEKIGKFRNPRKTSDSACVIFPPTVFRISEKPLHEFHGHKGKILDLSWSKNKYLLSSSVDKTVRLWRVGCNQCLKAFSHNNYVTCVQFNPVDDNYFISGSIDGKIRIWAISDCRVVDWTDIREIVTAVCYRPNGQGVIVGSLTGNCRFYDASGMPDNHLQLDAQISLHGKKKFPGKRITGFQFSPSDPSKLMVTSADSQVRILDGADVICKYRGFRNTGGQISASFTSDGKHIVSASEDSNVYVWNHSSKDGPVSKNIRSCERFFSSNISVAIPWCSTRSRDSVVSNTSGTHSPHQVSTNPRQSSSENGWKHFHFNENSNNTIPSSKSECFSLGNGFFSEALPKGSATWPVEKLPTSSSLAPLSMMRKSQYRFLKSSWHYTCMSPHAWGQVIVTAGLDGRIRSFHNYGLPVHP